jgi:quercetin dioxygenase-like cupin family protein
MRRFLLTLLFGGALLGGTAAFAAGGHGKITEKVLGAAGIAEPYTFKVDQPGDAIVAKATVPPGASFGWHSHRGDVVALIQKGRLSLYDSADPSCTAHRYSAGQGFTEQAGHVHLARNEGRKPVVVLVTYLGVPHGVNPDVPAKSPGNCPF